MNEDRLPRLKRLDLQGFKSFAGRTSFDFGRGITAVVGPNGSGKSNLADALRWVLGEQNPRALRLRKNEDVIFAGSGKRAPSGFAEVSIVLDNSEVWLPLEYSEVLVTRRLHRSGESEYLINRRRVRLRDIVDLFLKASLGQNSYAILGQGMVDLVLSLRPDERRGLIEEAADVRRHRQKADEALAQLAATRQNRDQAELLLSEIAPRVGQLEGQAQRAVHHARLRAELTQIQAVSYRLRQDSARETVARAQSRYGEAGSASATAAAEIPELEQRLQRIRSQSVEARRAMELDESRAQILGEELSLVERSLQDERRRLAELGRRRGETAADLLGLQREAAALEVGATPDGREDGGIEQAAQRISERESELHAAEARLSDAGQGLAAAEAEERRLRQLLGGVEERLSRLQRERARREQEADAMVKRRAAAIARLAAWGRDVRDTAQALRDRSLELRSAQQDLSRSIIQARVAAEAAGQQEARLHERGRELDACRHRQGLLEREQELRRPAEEPLLALLDALRGGGPGRPLVLGVVGGLIQVQRGLEIAIEAALAEQLNLAVVRTAGEALAAVETLQQIEAGRVTFVMLDALRGGHVLNLANESGVVGVAARFVRCDDAYRDLIDMLLGRVIIVENLEAGQNILQRGLGAAVTLDGTVLRPGGTVSGGRGKTEIPVFAAGRELEDLRTESARLEREHDVTTSEVTAARAEVRAAGERVNRRRAIVDDLSRQVQAADAAAAKLRRRLEPIRGELAWLRTASTEPKQRQATGESDGMQQSPEEAFTLERNQLRISEREHQQGALQVARALFERLRSERARLASLLAEARGELTAHQRERDALNALHQNRLAAAQRTERLLETRRQSLAVLEIQIREASTAAAKVEEELTRRRALAEGWPKQLTLLQEQAREAAAREQQEESNLAAARAQVNQQERLRLEAELSLRRAAETLQRLQDEMEREGITIEEMIADTGPQRGQNEAIPQSPSGLEKRLRELRAAIRALGAINPEAESDYRQTRDRYDFLSQQVGDLKQAESTLLEAIDELRRIARERFENTFAAVNRDFSRYFQAFFGGGQARLIMTPGENGSEAGVDIEAQPPGKRLQNLAVLSGGERSMTAVALLFAMLESNPAPFCVLDEVDAALDESNVGRFGAA
ncbi:MAG: chromosome segregation protein SMC, partial [Dehalococcoidia bacterium]